MRRHYLYCVKFLEPYTYGLTAGWQADKIQVNFEIFRKLAVGRNIRLVASFNQGTASLQPYQCIPASFSGKAYCKLGRYKQWNGLLEWNTGLDYWNGIFQPLFLSNTV